MGTKGGEQAYVHRWQLWPQVAVHPQMHYLYTKQRLQYHNARPPTHADAHTHTHARPAFSHTRSPFSLCRVHSRARALSLSLARTGSLTPHADACSRFVYKVFGVCHYPHSSDFSRPTKEARGLQKGEQGFTPRAHAMHTRSLGFNKKGAFIFVSCVTRTILAYNHDTIEHVVSSTPHKGRGRQPTQGKGTQGAHATTMVITWHGMAWCGMVWHGMVHQRKTK